ncbi:MAG: endonuclease MutS2 [Saccharofermentans sp.]|nr:endonuclease MutS2 [Saccharofermentans sp.]
MYEYLTFDESLEKRKIHGRVLETLEFVKIRDKISSHARTSYGKRLVSEILPCTDTEYVTANLEWTREAIDHIRRFGALPLGGMRYLDEHLSYADAGGTLTCSALLDVASSLKTATELKKAASIARSAGAPFVDGEEPLIMQGIDALNEIPELLSSIDECILGDSEVSDRASKELASIRREKKSTASGIRTILDRVISGNEDMLQDAIITIREGRYCIPVKADFKGRIPGIVHSSSSTGQTIFLEPMSVVEANNKIAELEAQEAFEIQRILSALTYNCTRNEKLLKENIEIVSALDLAMAKGEYAVETDSYCAKTNPDGRVVLKKARHPLIPGDSVVPIDIEVGSEYSTLIVTGPNTGGKTVSLKTCGLLTLMTMAGLAIPADSGSEVCIFDRVLADIGDEQSIEQSLSTFSAHISNIVFILRNIKGKSLVLLDELGSGTDPTEGAALAIAIIDALRSKGCITMATTHYRELKSYAIDTEGVMNASCEFDTETLAPTYRLIIGRPGSSNAFVISKKLGLSSAILESARSKLTSEEISYEQLIAKAEEDSKLAEQSRQEAEKLKLELEQAKKALEEERNKLKTSKTKILNESRAKQRELLEEREEEVEQMLKDFKKKSKNLSRQETIDELNKIRRRLRAGADDLGSDEDDEIAQRVALSGEKVREVVLGETYYVPAFDVTGTATSLPNKSGSLQITAGSMKFNCKVDQLRMPTAEQLGAKQQKQKGRTTPSSSAAKSHARFDAVSHLSSELMLIGMNTAEAESALMRYLEDCKLSGIKNARIVHGKGTGALRSCVRERLSNCDYVESFRDGIQGEGDSGVTIVTFC